MSTPLRPARPTICLYVSMSSRCPLNTGVLMITRRAGRFTPEDKVEVATRTLRKPWRKAPSRMSRSSNVRPKSKIVMNIKKSQLFSQIRLILNLLKQPIKTAHLYILNIINIHSFKCVNQGILLINQLSD